MQIVTKSRYLKKNYFVIISDYFIEMNLKIKRIDIPKNENIGMS